MNLGLLPVTRTPTSTVQPRMLVQSVPTDQLSPTNVVAPLISPVSLVPSRVMVAPQPKLPSCDSLGCSGNMMCTFEGVCTCGGVQCLTSAPGASTSLPGSYIDPAGNTCDQDEADRMGYCPIQGSTVPASTKMPSTSSSPSPSIVVVDSSQPLPIDQPNSMVYDTNPIPAAGPQATSAPGPMPSMLVTAPPQSGWFSANWWKIGLGLLTAVGGVYAYKHYRR